MSERSEFKTQIHNRTLACEEAVRYAAEVQPYWLSLRKPRDGELQWGFFDYFPAAHYQQARREHTIEPDGGHDMLHSGRQQASVYYWLDPRTGAALYHTSAYDDEANPFFGTVEDAEIFLEQRADTADDAERYESLSLYQARTRKVGDATDVLTEQAGIGDFVTDGGIQIEQYQLRTVDEGGFQ